MQGFIVCVSVAAVQPPLVCGLSRRPLPARLMCAPLHPRVPFTAPGGDHLPAPAAVAAAVQADDHGPLLPQVTKPPILDARLPKYKNLFGTLIVCARILEYLWSFLFIVKVI